MYVIAGVTGHVGSIVAEQLLAQGQKVRVVVRDEAKGATWSRKGAEVALGTLEDQAFLTSALGGAGGFFTLLPPSFVVSDFYAYQQRTSDAIAGAVAASGTPHVVLLSSVGADLLDGTGPIKGLHYLEEALRTAGTKLTAIRAGYFQENIANALGPARHAGVFPSFVSSADFPMPMIATQDIGALAARSLLSPPAHSEIIDLHGPAYSMRQLAEKLGDALNQTLRVIDIPPRGWVEAMMQGGMPKHIAEVFAEMYSAFAAGIIRPKGDRMEQGKTTIDEVIKTLV
ncbi:MAG: NmrA family NAD(P)-binding protein [Candidatus Schekmanbacteria bacterium]|nr:NmrA family NAD(P)-binding protein [Candidatus Schekmanbacteria bacterium]